MSLILRVLSYFLRTMFYQYAFRQAKRRAVLIYLKTLQVVRRSLMLAVLLFFTLQVMILGFIGSLVTGVWLLPIETVDTKLWILFGIFSMLFLLPTSVLFVFFSEKFWFKSSGASEFLQSKKAN